MPACRLSIGANQLTLMPCGHATDFDPLRTLSHRALTAARAASEVVLRALVGPVLLPPLAPEQAGQVSGWPQVGHFGLRMAV